VETELDPGPPDAADTPDPAATPSTSDTASAAAPTRRGLPPALPWILLVLAVVVAAVATWRWQELAALERQRAAVEATAGDFAVALTNWDAADGMADTREALRAHGTEAFAQDVDELFGGTEDLAALTELGARSEGEVRDLFVQSIADERAEALAVVVQRVSTDAGQETNLRYAAVSLVHSSGDWLVDQVELLVDATSTAGAP
jgi:hypothetical protein